MPPQPESARSSIATRISQAEFQKAIDEGRVTIGPKPSTPDTMHAGIVAFEKLARTVLPKDSVFASSELKVFEDKLRQVGQNVVFVYNPGSTVPYTQQDIEKARDQGETLVLRPSSMIVGKGKKQQEVPITIMTLRDILTVDPTVSGKNLFYSFNKGANDWYKDEPFATDEDLTGGWSLVSKEPLKDSFSKNYEAQTIELEKGGLRRRTTVEAVFDTMFSYVLTGVRPLNGTRDWTSSQAANGNQVDVGYFDEDGLHLSHWNPGNSNPYIGVVAQR